MHANGLGKYMFAKWRTILHTVVLLFEFEYWGAKCVTWQMEFT
jgi:hypothetical protein